MKKFLKYLLVGVIILVVGLFIFVKVASEAKPASNPSSEGDQLAIAMMDALGKPAYDTLRYMHWSSRRGYAYFFDKKENNALVSWDDIEVHLNLDQVDGRVIISGEEVDGEKKASAIAEAWNVWCNDSFWVLAPFKVMDPGTTRTAILDSETGNKNLLVEYSSGGTTPGDAYLWILDENLEPVGYKMWVSIIPVKGVYASWANWKEYADVSFSTLHKLSFLEFEFDLKAGNDLAAVGLSENPITL